MSANLRKLRLNQLVFMVQARVSSLTALASSVFMKRIRRLVYDSLYQDEALRKSLVSNNIYDIPSAPKSQAEGRPGDAPKASTTSHKATWPPKDLPAGVPEPSQALRQVTGRAAEVDTQLWFDGEQQLRDLVVCGQATMCFNLMKWLKANHGPDPEAYPVEVQRLWGRVLEDWKLFVEMPQALLDRRMKAAVAGAPH